MERANAERERRIEECTVEFMASNRACHELNDRLSVVGYDIERFTGAGLGILLAPGLPCSRNLGAS